MRKTYYNNTAFLDLLFNFLLATTILLVIAVSFIIKQSKADIKTKAEFVVTIDWTGEHDNDVDIWIEDPAENLLWYKQKEVGVMHLDRDDLGHTGDTHQTLDGEVSIIKINHEIATIRGCIEGEWVINLHLYRQGTKEPTTTKISLIKLNPRATVIFSKEFEMATYWEQITVARIFMTNSGKILRVEDGPFKDLIIDQAAQATTYMNQDF
jgi:hypothetical protein